jgi:pimeloyl-ACP methyl ester carboxylesterase
MRRVRSGGVGLAVHDLGGARNGPPLLLVHGTGFCAQTLAPLALQLGASFRCFGLDLRGHGLSDTPEGADFAWARFAEDVLAVMDGLPELGGTARFAFGHSAGGAAVLLAEADRPGTFAALWCYEPIVWPDPAAARSRAEWLAAGARRRRDRFASREDALANFSSKPPFNQLAPAALRAYVEHGFEEGEDGSVTLRCRPDVEGTIYLEGVEGDRFSRLRDVACPVVVACGARTEAIAPPVAQQIAGALSSGRARVLDRLGHFGPLEDPPAVAAAVLADVGSP